MPGTISITFWVVIWMDASSFPLPSLSPSLKPFLVGGSGERVLARAVTEDILFEAGANASEDDGSVNSRTANDLVKSMLIDSIFRGSFNVGVCDYGK